ncbi:MAG: N-acetyl-gamma-glutamyl-phosphate reductase, partial [Bacteroidetes bacterium]|nr:N-acetyl-gamma-glutamyl-phosphate reductase [Bacteroidota bacterium]
MKHKIGIMGGAGYTAGELLRILLHHPHTEIAWIHSQSHAGEPVYQVHGDLLGETQLAFSQEFDQDIDILFLCSGHGKSKAFLEENPFPESVKIIDLSTDFRMKSSDHDFVYGLP